MMHTKAILATCLLAAAPIALQADGDIDFTLFHAENIPAADIETAIGAATTAGLDGIALGPNGTHYAIHSALDESKTLFLVDSAVTPASITVLATDSEIKTDLGFTGTIIIEGGFTSSPDSEILYYMASDSADINAEIFLLAFDRNAVGNKHTVVASGSDVENTIDIATLPNGQIVLARGLDGVGIIDPADATPAFELKVSDQDFVDDLINNHSFPGTTTVAEGESLAVHPVTGQTFIFLHEVVSLYEIIDIDTATPTLQRILVAEWDSLAASVDMHGMVMDTEGVLYGLDEGNESIVIYDGTTGYAIPLDDISAELEHDHATKGLTKHEGGAAVTAYRGLAVRINSEGLPVLALSINNDETGVAFLEFGDENHQTSVTGWNLYY